MNARRVAVMGAGTMGSGIAAHLSNLGFDVLLFDLSREAAQAGLDRAQKAKPPHLYGPESVSRIRIASIADDLRELMEVDWVCEAIVEQAAAKRDLYARIEPLLRDEAMITTNTSGLEIGMLAEGHGQAFRRRFMGTHFFNPPRYLKLLELIPTSETDEAAVAQITRFIEDRVGKRVVPAKDTPGFIANRYGMWCLFQAIHTAEKLGFSVETVDAITGPFMGRPKTATFRLADLIGLDIMADVAGNLRERCIDDARIGVLALPASTARLIEAGWIGAKSGQGYYRRESSQYLALDFNTHEYRPTIEPDLPGSAELSKLPIGERLRTALDTPGEIGEFVREHLSACLNYALEVGPEISYSVDDFDNVMKWGWGWEKGPFELIDEIGYTALASRWPSRPLEEHIPFYGDGSFLNLVTKSHERGRVDPRYASVFDFETVSSGSNWFIRDDGDGGFIFQVNSKMNTLAPEIIEALIGHIEALPTARLTLANEGRAFSVGFNLAAFLAAAEAERYDDVTGWLKRLQACAKAVETANAAAAIRGYALGGGLELAMRSKLILAQAEAMLGLPETLVGLVPAGGGTALMRLRTQGDIKAMCSAAIALAAGRKVPATDGFKTHFLRATDRLAVNPDQLVRNVIDAELPENAALEWSPAPPPLAGMIDDEIERLRSAGELGEYGALLANEVKHIFVKPKSEEEALEFEAETFVRALGRPRTVLRIRHMLETGKPLNN